MVIWESINADLTPTAREALLDGRIHVAECPICNKTVKVHRPLLYHDMGREFLVSYSPFKSIRDPRFYEEFSVDGHLDFNPGLPEEEVPEYFKDVHYVFSMGELRRYIRFREILADMKGAGYAPIPNSE
jgi:hypothetical protein